MILLILFGEILAWMDIEILDSCNNDYKDVDECHKRFNQLKNKCLITMIFFSWKLSFLAFRNYTVLRLNNSYRELFSPIFRLSSDERFSINCGGIMDMLLIRFTMKDISKFLFKQKPPAIPKFFAEISEENLYGMRRRRTDNFKPILMILKI